MNHEHRESSLVSWLCSDDDERKWNERFISWQQMQGRKTIAALLGCFLLSRFAKAVVRMGGLEENARASDLKKESRRKLVSLLGKGISLKVDRVEGFDKAMVTSGGVECLEVNPRTMEAAYAKDCSSVEKCLTWMAPAEVIILGGLFRAGQQRGAMRIRIKNLSIAFWHVPLIFSSGFPLCPKLCS